MYMTIGALLLSPFAIWMTDFSQPINWGFKGPYLAFIIQILNSIGALTLVYALRYGKAIIVVPLIRFIACYHYHYFIDYLCSNAGHSFIDWIDIGCSGDCVVE